MPAEFYYFPFDDGPGSDSEENRWESMMKYMRTTGVLIPWDQSTLNPSTGDLAVTANGGLSVQTAVGEAWIHGFMFQQQDDYYSIAISPNSSGDPRIDLVTARLDTDANTIVIHVEEGTPDPSPVAPTPVESDPIWDLSLAEVYVADGAVTILSGDITDVRVRSIQGNGGSSPLSHFLSTVQTGTGSPQTIAHGLGTTPFSVVITPVDTTALGIIASGFSTSYTSDSTNVYVTATSGLQYTVSAWANY